MWVVKLGGSLANGGRLPAWLQALAGEDARDVIIVPGGGPFAEAVRTSQSRWRFDDTAAHRMAVLAMEQYGTMLLAMQPELSAGTTPFELTRRTAVRAARVWMPARMVLSERSLPATWSLTSDSLAAWLAGTLRAEHLVLVKSVQLPGVSAGCGELQARGIVDRAFGAYIEQAGFTSWLCGPDDADRLRQALRTRTDPGVSIVADSGRTVHAALADRC